MPTIDEETLIIYREMQAAARDGNLLSYANRMAIALGSNQRDPERVLGKSQDLFPKQLDP